MAAFISFDPKSPGGYDAATFGRPCRCCGSELWAVTNLAMCCSGECKARRLIGDERVLGYFDAGEWRLVGGPPRLMGQAEARRRGFKPNAPYAKPDFN